MRGLILLLLALPLQAQTVAVGDAWVVGKTGVNTTSPSARLDVKRSSASGAAFQVSGVDETPFFQVSSDGRLGLGTAPAANLDATWMGSGSTGLDVRQGNISGSTRWQMLFGYAGQAINRHGILSRHNASLAGNSVNFYLWTPAAGTSSDLPVLEVLSLVTTSTGVSVHVRPSGNPDVELEVSDGSSTGGGTVHRALEATHSSKALKTDIVYLDAEAQARALEDVKALRPTWFRYQRQTRRGLVADSKSPMRRGLIYEETPESIRDRGESVSIDERVTNAELALKALAGRIERLQRETAPR